MASGHVNRVNRPNTWLHRPMLQREESPCQPGAVHTWHISAPDVCDGTSAVGKADTAFQAASVGQPTEPCLGGSVPGAMFGIITIILMDVHLAGHRLAIERQRRSASRWCRATGRHR